MANSYEKEVLGYSTIAVVLEDSVWEFGKEKKKAKINIPVLMPLQEPSSAVKIVEKKNSKVGPVVVEKTRNYIELFLPDDLYTHPTEGDVTNPHQTLFGAKSTNKSNNGKNGSKTKGLIRKVEKDTKLVITVVDGYALEENIKILFKFDDFDENTKGIQEVLKHGLTPATKAAAVRH